MNNEPDKSSHHTKGGSANEMQLCIYGAITENQSESEHSRNSRPIKSKLGAMIIVACGAWPPTQWRFAAAATATAMAATAATPTAAAVRIELHATTVCVGSCIDQWDAMPGG